MLNPVQRVSLVACRHGVSEPGARAIPEEAPVSLVYNGGTYAVMMASPSDLHDFAIGFSLTERIIDHADEIEELEIVEQSLGLEIRLWLRKNRAEALAARRRAIAGPTGCGLCGIDSLAEAMRQPLTIAAGGTVSTQAIHAALAALGPAQTLNQQTRAVHAAALWTPGAGLAAVREDVGRHNALDKLVGAVKIQSVKTDDGMLLLTSRVSIEIVQKACVLGAPVLVAVSAPTALAVRMADEAGLTLIGIARDDGFEIFTHSHRLSTEALHHVA